MEFNAQKLMEEYLNDKSLTEEERKIALVVLKTEMNMENSNNLIGRNMYQIDNLRHQIINDATAYTNSDNDEYKEIANSIIAEVASPMSITNGKSIENTGFITEHRLASDSLDGTIDIYMDNQVAQKVEQVNGLAKNTYRINERKYMNIENDLSAIFPEELLSAYYDENGNPDIDKMKNNYMILEGKVSELNTDSQIKGILRKILLDKRQHLADFNIPVQEIDLDVLTNNNSHHSK